MIFLPWKKNLSSSRFGLQKDKANHHTFVSNSILHLNNLQKSKNKVMDDLVEVTQKKKVLKEKLNVATCINAQMNE